MGLIIYFISLYICCFGSHDILLLVFDIRCYESHDILLLIITSLLLCFTPRDIEL